MTIDATTSIGYEDYARPEDMGSSATEFMSGDQLDFHKSELPREHVEHGIKQLDSFANGENPESPSLQEEVEAHGGVEAAAAEMIRETEELLLMAHNLTRVRNGSNLTSEDVTAHRNAYGLAA